MTLQPLDAPTTQEEAERKASSPPYTSLARDMFRVKEDESTHISLKDEYDPAAYNWRGVPIEGKAGE